MAIDSLRAKFYQLKKRWNDQTCFLSDMGKAWQNRHYLEILALGPLVVPLILEDMKKEVGHWFHALETLTGEIPEEFLASDYLETTAGNIPKMNMIWINWAVKNGFLPDNKTEWEVSDGDTKA